MKSCDLLKTNVGSKNTEGVLFAMKSTPSVFLCKSTPISQSAARAKWF